MVIQNASDLLQFVGTARARTVNIPAAPDCNGWRLEKGAKNLYAGPCRPAVSASKPASAEVHMPSSATALLASQFLGGGAGRLAVVGVVAASASSMGLRGAAAGKRDPP